MPRRNRRRRKQTRAWLARLERERANERTTRDRHPHLVAADLYRRGLVPRSVLGPLSPRAVRYLESPDLPGDPPGSTERDDPQ